jgi:hypothetical protein
MERTASVRTQPKNVACVGRYLGMNQNDVKHHLLPFLLDSAQFHHQYLAHIINDVVPAQKFISMFWIDVTASTGRGAD